jgi:hypothetical protein
MLPLRGNQSQPTRFFVFINERPVSALQSHHQALHKHEWTALFSFTHLLFYMHVLPFYTKFFILYNLYLHRKRKRPSPSTHVELSIHVCAAPGDGFVKPKLVAH